MWAAAYSSDLSPAGVVEELSTSADEASLLAGSLVQHISCAEVVGGKQGGGDAGCHTRVVQTLLIDLLQSQEQGF